MGEMKHIWEWVYGRLLKLRSISMRLLITIGVAGMEEHDVKRDARVVLGRVEMG